MEVAAIMFEYYVDPILGPQFVSLGVKESSVGYGFSVIGGSFGIGSLVAGRLCSVMHRNYVIQIGSFFQGVGILFVGPSKLLGLPTSIPLMYVGFFFIGFFAAFSFTVIIPGVIDTIEIEQKKKADKTGVAFIPNNEQLGDKASALFNVSYALGGIISPILGGALYDKVGFQETADIMSALALAISLLFLLGGLIPFILKKKSNIYA